MELSEQEMSNKINELICLVLELQKEVIALKATVNVTNVYTEYVTFEDLLKKQAIYSQV